ncbi:DoxX family protein [Halalkalicoccus sp. NIPERK01]|uniref:DoxX family protein n=1 Tax=Halalkalicoccus sp. NIPERK01 TaxID=3053469 RepID=UPI00256F0298|nr:DoxX family protein [Halalkalicoccus sp. NIPERK01]MDL5362312.1 DoxX family protein [Halalkalicoccus sp. NIPERK01]
MATATPIQEPNVFESKIGGITVRGQAHSLSAWFVLALRLMMGLAFLNAGLSKLLGPEPFSAQGFLLGAVPANGGPLVDVFAWIGQTGWMLAFVDVAVPFGQVAIGLALLVGAFVRLAAFWGAFMMATFYFANWDVAHGLINGDFAYMLVFLAVAAFGAGRILGLDTLIERYEVDGTPLLEKYPKLDYVLG